MPRSQSVEICAISPICVPSRYTRQEYTDAADLTDTTDLASPVPPYQHVPLLCPRSQSVEICAISPICVPSRYTRQEYTDAADLTDTTDLASPVPPYQHVPLLCPARNQWKSAQSVQSVFQTLMPCKPHTAHSRPQSYLCSKKNQLLCG